MLMQIQERAKERF